MKEITAEVLDRMFSRAQEKMIEHGWKDQEVTAFMNDPVIRMFYGSCAEELGKLKDEIGQVENRLIKKTIEHLIPEVFQMPLPAHAILHAQPVNKLSECTIWPEVQFLLSREVRGKEYAFTPAGHFTLTKAEIEYLVFRDRFYQYKGIEKQQIMSGDSQTSIQDDVLWLGIKDLNKSIPKENIPLFFSFTHAFDEERSFLNALRFCKCQAGDDQTVSTFSGLPGNGLSDMEQNLVQPDQSIYRILNNTRNWYKKYYLTLHHLPKNNNEENQAFPLELRNRFSRSDLDKLKDDIYWIKLSFGNLLNPSWIQKLYCSINCFPVVNLRLEQKLFDVEEMPVNIYPVMSDDFIMAIRSIGGKVKLKQEEYNYNILNPEVKSSVSKEGEAIFKRGSLGRINAQRLKSMLNQLISVLREEIVLLTRDGTKEDLLKLNRLNQAVIDFENCLEIEKEKSGKYSGSVILKAFKDQNKVYIRYWTSAAEAANSIKPFAGEDASKQCAIGFAPDVLNDSLQLITTTVGGKNQPSDEDYIDTLRKLLLTRSRIVTPEDVKAFCYEYFHPAKVSVSVGKSARQSNKPGFGIVRMIDVKIRFNEKQSFTNEELLFFREEMLQILEQHSANVMPFNVEFV